MKTLDDVKADMSELYEHLKAGEVETKTASELANIAGKYLAMLYKTYPLGVGKCLSCWR